MLNTEHNRKVLRDLCRMMIEEFATDFYRLEQDDPGNPENCLLAKNHTLGKSTMLYHKFLEERLRPNNSDIVTMNLDVETVSEWEAGEKERSDNPLFKNVAFTLHD